MLVGDLGLDSKRTKIFLVFLCAYIVSVGLCVLDFDIPRAFMQEYLKHFSFFNFCLSQAKCSLDGKLSTHILGLN